MKKLCSLMLHTAKVFNIYDHHTYSLYCVRTDQCRETLNTRLKLGLFILHSILTFTKLKYFMTQDLGAKA